jgi:adenylate kinase
MLQAEVDNNRFSRIFVWWFSKNTARQGLRCFCLKKESITATIALEADDEILVARLLDRGKTSGRADDQDEEKIRNRYQEYNEKTAFNGVL